MTEKQLQKLAVKALGRGAHASLVISGRGPRCIAGTADRSVEIEVFLPSASEAIDFVAAGLRALLPTREPSA